MNRQKNIKIITLIGYNYVSVFDCAVHPIDAQQQWQTTTTTKNTDKNH